MKRVFNLLCLLTASVVASSACGSPAQTKPVIETTESAVPAVQVDTYGQDLTRSEQFRLATAAAIRAVDPCAVLDLNYVETLGSVTWMSLDAYPSRCTALYMPPDNSGTRLDKIQIDFASAQPFSEDLPFRIGGVTAYRSATSDDLDGCQVKLPFNPLPRQSSPTTDVVEVPPRVYVSVWSKDRTSDSCAGAEARAADILPRLGGELPTRTRTEFPLAERGPCDFIGLLPPVYAIEPWEPTEEPHECEVGLTTPVRSDLSVAFELAIGTLYVRPTDRVEVVGGLSYRVSIYGNSCTVRSMLGPPITPVYGLDTDTEPDRFAYTPMVVLNGPCDVTEAVARAFLPEFAS